MKRKAKLPFDPKVFLSKVNGGRAIADYRKDQIVYMQGEPADSVFYPARMLRESLNPGPELENGQGQTRPSRDCR